VAFDRGELDAVVRAERSRGRTTVTALVPDSDVRTTLVVVQLRDALRAFERTERAERANYLDSRPLALPPEGSANPYYGFTYTVLLPLLLFLPVFVGGSIAVDSITEERERGTLELLRVAPVSIGDIVDSKLFATASIAPVQALAWLVLLEVNGTAVRNVPLLVVLVSGLSLAVVAFGVGIALWSSDRRQAQFLYSTGIIAAATLGGLLPEHPANTVARLAIGTTSRTTIALALLYALIGLAAYVLVRVFVDRIDPETL